MKIKQIGLATLFSAMAATGLFMSDKASAGSCQTYIDKANQVFGNLMGNSCVGITNTPSLDNNPFIYTNPDGGCDLGLSLPGLPSFGGSLGSLDSCSIVKMVTSDTVSKVNSTIRDAMNTSVNTINQTAQDTIGTNVTGGSVNVTDLVEQRVQEATSGK
ncbi:hypothetical protein [Pseudomonas amygdali]|uniref:Uncharacterized protein n=2 Tax=Pseudomonas amygdali pv. lachrymans TaxID=53707 RepID=A0ABR5KQB0_PSEAV|nr:hypothetical protein [Pseudomonas amygdali]AXH59458.1 hypothetical protein PLA107_029980 [Pseudomonas amygdali pv. lachrymans str. M301315]KPC16886.1 Uncharacterized protein AC499_0088 [Pseudomonas amygdali pv. lachrymans]KPC17845.1 Uncharacterized protein AC499_1047 [Pseudomonas amygdali pv. lachrymans]RMT06566.1 hypothetical protein ALP54_03387 [Pseudomonas amygdali pv. lachrymans]